MSNYGDLVPSAFQHMMRHNAERAVKQDAANDAQLLMPSLLSGNCTWLALQRAVDDLVSSAPENHDVLIQVGDISVIDARFIAPHTFIFTGFNHAGHRTGMVMHFSQVCAQVVYLPKRGPDRVVTGFSNESGA